MTPSKLHLLCAAILLTGPSLQADTTLDILNPNTLGSTITVQPGKTFNAEVYVSNLSAALDSFSLTFDLPTGVTLQSFTNTVPAGWTQFTNVALDEYGAFNLSGNDITPSGELVLATFAVTNTFVSGSMITFPSDMANPLQTLNDANGTQIGYTPEFLTLDLATVPEPQVWLLLAIGCGLLFYGNRLQLVRALAARTGRSLRP